MGGLPRSGRPSYRPRPPPEWSGRGWWAAVELLLLGAALSWLRLWLGLGHLCRPPPLWQVVVVPVVRG